MFTKENGNKQTSHLPLEDWDRVNYVNQFFCGCSKLFTQFDSQNNNIFIVMTNNFLWIEGKKIDNIKRDVINHKNIDTPFDRSTSNKFTEQRSEVIVIVQGSFRAKNNVENSFPI